MNGKKSLSCTLTALALCLIMLLTPTVYAFAEEAAPAEEESKESIIDEKELSALVDAFREKYSLDESNFSLGYYYSATGDEWFYNPDTWFYPASMYKVPLIMCLSERVKSGEISQDTEIEGKTVAQSEEYILTYSNNDIAHTIRKYLGGDEQWRAEAKKYARLEDADYDPDYMDYCYFSARYMTQVMETLYNERDRFPNVVECLLEAEPTHYFRLSDEMNNVYDIAQKYGSFCDSLGHNFNHTTGIVYTPNPCIITVMTCNVQDYEYIISEAAKLLTKYTLSLDDGLEAFRQEQEDKREAEEEAERQAAEEKAAQEQAAKEKAEAERVEREALQKEQEKQAKLKKILRTAGIAVGAAFLLFVIVLIINKILGRKYEEHIRQEQMKHRNAAQGGHMNPETRERRGHANDTPPRGSSGKSSGSGKYKPKH